MEEAEKKAFFNELWALDVESEDEPEDLSIYEPIMRSKPEEPSRCTVSNPNALKRLSGGVPLQRHSLERTVSAPIQMAVSFPSPQNSKMSVSNIHKNSRLNATKVAPIVDLTKDEKVPGITGTKMKLATKRKRGQSPKLAPEALQVFRNFIFFFIPNSDIGDPRRRRMAKAAEYGATRAKEWTDNVTHIIVDKDLHYTEVLRALQTVSLRTKTKAILVNEDYPAYCITNNYLMDPQRSNYRVKGHKEALQANLEEQLLETKENASSDMSLQLKPRKHTKESEQTASRTDSSDLPRPATTDKGSSSGCGHHMLSESSAIPAAYIPDALSEAIEEAQATKDLPLDLDEDESNGDPSSFEISDNESEEEKRPKAKSKKSSNTSWQQGFSCMTKHDGTGKSENPNTRTIEVLQQMADYYDRSNDHWRLIAYRKVIGQLKRIDVKVVTAAQAIQIPWVGHRLADKIEEIVWTNKLRRLDSTKFEPNDEVLQTFLNIYGVGLSQATKWVNQGHRTLADLTSKVSLTKNQEIGIDHFDDFQQRIHRAEVQEHDTYVRDFATKIDPALRITIGGSYRRGAASSGDIDFIVSMSSASASTIRTIMLSTVIPRLFRTGYLKAGLATTGKNDGSKWHGAAALPGHTVWRRIDFLIVPEEELGAALIYFTGNDIFNRSIRLLASKKGMRLNQRGLWRNVIRGKRRERVTQGTLVEGRDERKIFEHLGVPWRPPMHRIC